MNLSFAGCGFLGLYHLGVVSCIKTYAPRTFSSKVALLLIPYYTPAMCNTRWQGRQQAAWPQWRSSLITLTSVRAYHGYPRVTMRIVGIRGS